MVSGNSTNPIGTVCTIGLCLCLLLLVTAGLPSTAYAQRGDSIPVTIDKFVRAETDMYLARFVERGALGKFIHLRDLPLEDARHPNRDTLYSAAVFDLDAGAVTITLPDPGKRYLSLMIIDEDHYVSALFYRKGAYRLARANVGTRYAFAIVRALVNPDDPADVAQIHAVQDAVGVSQPGGPGGLEIPKWDSVSQDKLRETLQALGEAMPDYTRAFGRKDEVDAVRHLIGTATRWGSTPDKDTLSLNVVPPNNDGGRIFRLTVPDTVPVDGFWSVTVYNAERALERNTLDNYSFNSIMSKRNADGTVVIQFGGCDSNVPNCLPIANGWNYTIRFYRPRAEILNGSWKFPNARVVN
jgi:hypothetical protein